nr:hypothetical protein [Mycobacterium sp. DL440]
MGLSGASSSSCIIWQAPPSISTTSPSSSLRTCRVYSVSAFQVIGFRPIVTRAVKPVPNATTSRPGANASTAATADAVTMGCRMLGTATPVPRPMRSVASAIRAKEIQISVYSEGESNSQARS